MTKQSLYDRIGQKDAIRAVVTKMYEKILGDDRISLFFADMNMESLRRMNTEFVSMAFGGSTNYQGRDLRSAHAHLIPKGLNDGHFDIVAGHLHAAMRECGVDEALIREGLAVVESVRSEVLNK